MKNTLYTLIVAILSLLIAKEAWSLSSCSGLLENYHNCVGTKVFDNGDKWVGEWRNGEIHGQGVITYPDGTTYEGEVRNNKRLGQGVVTLYNGVRIEGEFINNVVHEGVITYPSGKRYEGEWDWYKDWAYNGFGVFTTPDGGKYEGEWENGRMSGHGIFSFPNGLIYAGEWKDAAFHGEGILIDTKDGGREEGIWANGILINSQQITLRKKEYLNDDKTEPNSSGSGFSVTSLGHVVTNYHVVEGCNSIDIHFNGRPISATVIGFDPGNDLALIKGDFIPLQYFSLRKKSPQLLMDIYVAGYPFGYELSTPVKVTKGIVSSLSGVGNNYSNIQIDAALQPGNSGGPIIDIKGNVVGVAVSKLDLVQAIESFGVIPEGTNFGIKSNLVISLLEGNNIKLADPNTSTLSGEDLGKLVTDATYYISCKR